MNEGQHPLKTIEGLSYKHLAQGVKPIIVGIGTFEDFGFKKPGKDPETLSPEDVEKNLGLTNVKNVDQGTSLYNEEKDKETLDAGPSTYVISPIDDFNKFSENFHRCIGLVVAGIDKKTGKNISFLSHQDPHEFLYSKKEEFIDDLKKRLVEMKDRCKENTMDGVIVGGKYFSDRELDFHQLDQIYNDAIKLVGNTVESTLNLKPSITNGPKPSRDKDSVYYDNENRRLYFIRPSVNPNTGDFPYDKVDNQEKTWEEKY